jgi:hypothetical protein
MIVIVKKMKIDQYGNTMPDHVEILIGVGIPLELKRVWNQCYKTSEVLATCIVQATNKPKDFTSQNVVPNLHPIWPPTMFTIAICSNANSTRVPFEPFDEMDRGPALSKGMRTLFNNGKGVIV